MRTMVFTALTSICISSERGRVFTGELLNCVALVRLSSYSGNAYWPSMWNLPVTPGAPVSGWPPPMLMV